VAERPALTNQVDAWSQNGPVSKDQPQDRPSIVTLLSRSIYSGSEILSLRLSGSATGSGGDQ